MSYQENEPDLKPGFLQSVNNFFTTVSKNTISPQQLKNKMRRHPEKLFLLDIRSRNSFKDFHLQGAVSMPPDGWSYLNHADLEADKEIVIICQKGIMSQEAVRILKSRGFPKVTALRGGIDYWLEFYR